MAGKPSNVGPMKPCARPRACASSWLHEVKHDGYRIIGLKAGRARHAVDPPRRGFHQQVGEDRGGDRQAARRERADRRRGGRGETAYAFSTALPDKAYAATLIDGASNVADALLGPGDMVFGSAILGTNGSGSVCPGSMS